MLFTFVTVITIGFLGKVIGSTTWHVSGRCILWSSLISYLVTKDLCVVLKLLNSPCYFLLYMLQRFHKTCFLHFLPVLHMLLFSRCFDIVSSDSKANLIFLMYLLPVYFLHYICICIAF